MKDVQIEDQLFDNHAERYNEDLSKGISLSGEVKEYFAEHRVLKLHHSLEKLNAKPVNIMDFGCGVGTATPFLRRFFPQARLLGLDVSKETISIAQRTYPPEIIRFATPDVYHPSENMDLAYCNGVFHHIPPDERSAALRFIRDSLKKGGFFSFWENNPWNPGTRLVMNRIPFDKDAVTINAREAVKILSSNGFDVLGVSFWFIYPSFLSKLRFTENCLSKLPFGAQYHVLCQRL